jgi:DUF2075 family protein
VDEEKFVQVVAAKQSQQRKKSQASLMLQYRIKYNLNDLNVVDDGNVDVSTNTIISVL